MIRHPLFPKFGPSREPFSKVNNSHHSWHFQDHEHGQFRHQCRLQHLSQWRQRFGLKFSICCLIKALISCALIAKFTPLSISRIWIFITCNWCLRLVSNVLWLASRQKPPSKSDRSLLDWVNLNPKFLSMIMGTALLLNRIQTSNRRNSDDKCVAQDESDPNKSLQCHKIKIHDDWE